MEDLHIHETNEFLGGEPEQNDLFAQTEPIVSSENATDSTASQEMNKNFDFYNNVQNITPFASNGGSNTTRSTTPAFKKRRKHNKMQRISRRINRNH
ncbi:MAG: hypothetical protein J6X18_01105 [Bacteroidales bacterium]|nr:hypothetical protein [Bacteroidales bacterium]